MVSQLSIMGQIVLCELLAIIKKVTGSPWFSIIANKATDVCGTEQLNLSFNRSVITLKFMRILLSFFFMF